VYIVKSIAQRLDAKAARLNSILSLFVIRGKKTDQFGLINQLLAKFRLPESISVSCLAQSRRKIIQATTCKCSPTLKENRPRKLNRGAVFVNPFN
jgi:hypothetical protein